MVQLKKKVTLRTKQPVKDSPTIAATDVNMSGAEGNKTNSNGKKLWILVAVIILAAGGYIYFSNEDHSLKNVIQEQRIVQANDSSSTENSKAADENIALNEASNEASQDSATLQAAAGSIGKDLSEKSKSTEHKNKQTNDAKVANKTATNIAGVLSGSLEEKARQVIRGDYGNGDVRKQNLGSEYVDIQGKVNELYRKGAVR